MRILVTGGAGFLGSVLVSALLDAGDPESGFPIDIDHVTVLDNFMFGQMPLNHLCANPDFDVVRGDARDPRILNPLLKKADVLIPLAALVGAPLCDRDEMGAQSTNLGAVLLMKSLASRDQPILIPITNSGYGVGEPGVECTEDSPLRPVSLYGRLKVEAEKAVLDRGNAISFRLATLFGMSPRMRLDLLVNDFVHRAITDRAVVLYESHFKRNYLHVRDAAGAFLHALAHFDEMKDRPYNVGLSDANLSKRELCERIAVHVPGFTFLDAPVGEDPDKRDYVVSNWRIESAGWRPRRSLDDGIRELIKGLRMLPRGAQGNV
jgi:nucleoside-diphosphate-sugar epimerase